MQELQEFAMSNGYTVRPTARRNSDCRPGGYQSGGNTKSPKRTDKLTIKCLHCGKMGHFSRDCKGPDKGFKFAPPKPNRICSLEVDDTDSRSDLSNST